jgi:hypothetical protein
MSSDAMIEDTEALARLKALLRDWEHAKLDGFPGLKTDIAVMRENIRKLEKRPAATSSRG